MFTLCVQLCALRRALLANDVQELPQNQDTLKTRTKCLDLVRASLAVKKSVVVDNTSPSVSVRKEYLNLVRSEFPTSSIRILHFTAHRDLCVHNSFFRASARGATRDALPQIAFNSYATNLEVPKDSEGERNQRTQPS